MAVWQDEQDTDVNVQWARDLFKELQKFRADSVYYNFYIKKEDEMRQETAASYYGYHADKLMALKQKYDPGFVFHPLGFKKY